MAAKKDSGRSSEEYKAFIALFADVSSAIQDPVVFAGQLLQAELIGFDVYRDVCSLGLERSYQVSKLMQCVEPKIEWSVDNLYVFIKVLEKDPTTVGLANKLKEKCLKYPYINDPQVKLPFSPHSAVQIYFNYLQAIYLRELHKTDPKWPPVQMNEYINLLWINKAGVFLHEGKVINEHIIRGDIDYVEGTKTKMTFADLANLKDGSQPQCIVVEGAPGSGKTMFSWEVCSRWAKGEILQQYSVLSLLQLRDPEVREVSKIADLFPNSSADLRKEIIEARGKNCCILLDGFDELPEDKRKEHSFFMKLLTGKLLPLTTVIITSRPWATNNFVWRYRHRISQHIEIVGFTRENVDKYIIQAFPEETQRSIFQQYIKRYPYIRSVMYIPLNCAIVVEVFRESGSIEDAPKTLTQLYTKLVKTALLRYLKCHPIYKDGIWYLGNNFKNNFLVKFISSSFLYVR